MSSDSNARVTFLQTISTAAIMLTYMCQAFRIPSPRILYHPNSWNHNSNIWSVWECVHLVHRVTYDSISALYVVSIANLSPLCLSKFFFNPNKLLWLANLIDIIILWFSFTYILHRDKIFDTISNTYYGKNQKKVEGK